MALGGGTFVAQNKDFPGSYINVVSVPHASAQLSDRGVAAIPMSLDWGPTGVFAVDAVDFFTDSRRIFGYDYTDDKLKYIREAFAHATRIFFYNVNTGGEKAKNTLATAKYNGEAGNNFKIAVDSELDGGYVVKTLFGNEVVDEQTVKAANELKENDYVVFSAEAELAQKAAIALEGGNSGTATAWQAALDALESYSFNTLGCVATDDVTKGLFVNYTKRMRDEIGAKFQLVGFKLKDADYWGVISVENHIGDKDDDPGAVYWVTGAEASCAVNKSLLNAKYDGELDINVDYTQQELKDFIKQGKFAFHRNGENVCVLDDVNTFVTFTTENDESFSRNQVIRVLDQCAIDVATIFNSRYLGVSNNIPIERTSLRDDIIDHHQQLADKGALDAFDKDAVSVERGATKRIVVVDDTIEPTEAMRELYMTIRCIS